MNANANACNYKGGQWGNTFFFVVVDYSVLNEPISHWSLYYYLVFIDWHHCATFVLSLLSALVSQSIVFRKVLGLKLVAEFGLWVVKRTEPKISEGQSCVWRKLGSAEVLCCAALYWFRTQLKFWGSKSEFGKRHLISVIHVLRQIALYTTYYEREQILHSRRLPFESRWRRRFSNRECASICCRDPKTKTKATVNNTLTMCLFLSKGTHTFNKKTIISSSLSESCITMQIIRHLLLANYQWAGILRKKLADVLLSKHPGFVTKAFHSFDVTLALPVAFLLQTRCPPSRYMEVLVSRKTICKPK